MSYKLKLKTIDRKQKENRSITYEYINASPRKIFYRNKRLRRERVIWGRTAARQERVKEEEGRYGVINQQIPTLVSK